MKQDAMCALLTVLAQEGAGGQQGAAQWISLLAPFALIFVVFYLLVIRPQQKREKERVDMLKELKKNDRVVTNGGFFGVVVSVKEPWVVLRVDENNDVRVKVLLNAVQGKAPVADKPDDNKGEK